MEYLFLAMAIGFEIGATTLLKYSQGFSRLLPTVLCLAAYFICHTCFSRAVLEIPLGVAYAIWCGVGIVATALISSLVFGDSLSAAELLGMLLVAAGCILMNLA